MVKNKMNAASKIAFMGLLLALALILSYVENVIPIAPGIPGIKLGLANVIVLLLLYSDMAAEAFLLNAVRIMLAAFLFGSMSSMIYAFSGALLSFFVMLVVKKTGLFAKFGVSAAGGFFHNLGQLMIAAVVLRSAAVFSYFPYLAIAGILTGLLNGYFVHLLMKYKLLEHIK